MSAAAKKIDHPAVMTVDEFLDWPGDGTGTRYELVDGQLRAQDARSEAHGGIHGNIARLIGNHVHGTNCRVVIGGGVRPHLLADWNFRVPDISVTCAPNLPGARDVAEPKLLIEIVSPTNKAETWDNVRNYVTLPTVQEIVLISTSRAEADILRRGPDGHWPQNPLHIGRAGPIPLASIGLDMAMADVYWGTHLSGRAG
jgi:Uma2 family endonuclease